MSSEDRGTTSHTAECVSSRALVGGPQLGTPLLGARYVEIWGDMGRCVEICGDMWRYVEICGDMGEMWGDVGRWSEDKKASRVTCPCRRRP